MVLFELNWSENFQKYWLMLLVQHVMIVALMALPPLYARFTLSTLLAEVTDGVRILRIQYQRYFTLDILVLILSDTGGCFGCRRKICWEWSPQDPQSTPHVSKNAPIMMPFLMSRQTLMVSEKMKFQISFTSKWNFEMKSHFSLGRNEIQNWILFAQNEISFLHNEISFASNETQTTLLSFRWLKMKLKRTERNFILQ